MLSNSCLLWNPITQKPVVSSRLFLMASQQVLVEPLEELVERLAKPWPVLPLSLTELILRELSDRALREIPQWVLVEQESGQVQEFPESQEPEQLPWERLFRESLMDSELHPSPWKELSR